MSDVAPSLLSVWLKAARAQRHFNEFEEATAWLQRDRRVRFECRIENGGYDHVYLPVDPPNLGPEVAAILGDCIHNYRSALDHLAWQLVLANRGTPDSSTSFPVKPPDSTTQVEVSGGVAAEVLDVVEAVQPRHRSSHGRNIWRIHRWDIIDKHRHLPVVQAVASQFSTWAGDRRFGGGIDRVDITAGLVHGQEALRIRYARPEPQEDRALSLYPSVVMSDVPGIEPLTPVRQIVGQFRGWLVDEFVPLFTPYIEAEWPPEGYA